MINRVPLRCSTCNESVLTRTAIGHSDYQEFAFPCPGCGVEIRFGMDLDQEAGSFEYRKPINAVWDEQANDYSTTLTFDAEILVPRDSSRLCDNTISPFIYMVSSVKNMMEFKHITMLRMNLFEDAWPVLRNCHIHFTNGNWDLYRQEFRKIAPEFVEDDVELLVRHHLRHLHRFSSVFRPGSDSMSQLLRQRVNLAESVSASACTDFLRYLQGIGWDQHLFEELMGLKERWRAVYGVVQPVYAYYDLADGVDIADFTLSQKRFDDIKGFFVDSYETLCRISLIAGAIEGIIAGLTLQVPSTQRSIPVEEYRVMSNGMKKGLVSLWPSAAAFAQMGGNQLRNGVGHHSARYSVVTDSIEYRIENRAGVNTSSISYMEFCLQLVKTYSSLELASVLVHWVVARGKGLTGQVV